MVFETDVVIVVFLQNLSSVKLLRYCHMLKCWMTNVHCGGCVVARPETGLEMDASRLDGDLAAYSVNQTRLQRTLLGQYFLRPLPRSGVQYFGLSVVFPSQKRTQYKFTVVMLCCVIAVSYTHLTLPTIYSV